MARYASAKVIKTVRAVIRDRDSIADTRPPVARGITSPTTTVASEPYDDRVTLVFQAAAPNVQYPFGFKQGDVNIIGAQQVLSASTPGLGFPNRGGGLIAPGNVVKNVPDAYIRDIPGSLLDYRADPAHVPFIEQNLYPVESASLDDPFYQTGSSVVDVGLGFDQPLWSKTKIEIDLTPTTAKTFGYTQEASAGNQQPKYTPMVYYNFAARTWDVVGRPTQAAGFRADSELTDWLGQAPIGFTRGAQLLITATNLACLPCSNFGFPMHPKFHARPDYTLHLSGIIDRPFLLEKFAYEFDASYTTGSTGERFDRLFGLNGGSQTFTNHAASIMTFFMLNQRAPASASSTFDTPAASNTGFSLTYQVTGTLPADISLSGSDGLTRVDTSRDLVTFAQVVAYSGSVTPNAGAANTTINAVLAGGLGRELNVDVSADGISTSMSRRVLALSGTVKQTQRLERQFGWRIVGDTKVQFQQDFGFLSGTNVPGGRNNVEMGMTGRDWVASQPGGVLGSQPLTDIGGAVIYPSPTANTVVSPYILFPTDNLVVGWQAPHLLDGQIVSASQASPVQGLGPQMTLYPGKGKLVLYGSMIRDANELHDTLRQSLTSDAVYESIHCDNPVVDQFDTEPFCQLSGSYIDNIVSGTVSNHPTSRGVYANNANPGAPAINLGTTINDRLVSVNMLKQGFRNAIHVCPTELFYDCLLPNPTSISHMNDAVMTSLDFDGKDVGMVNLDVGVKFGSSASTVNGDSTWSMSYPFEPRYSIIKRELDPFTAVAVDKALIGTSSFPVSNKVVHHFVVRRSMLNGTGNHALVAIIDANPEAGNGLPLRNADARKHYFGIGDLNTFVSSSLNTTGSHNIPGVCFFGGSNTAFGVVYRGWKYGIKNGVREYSKAVFRRDRFGQHRDMFEQRLDAKYYIVAVEGLGDDDKHNVTKGETASPVTVNFVASDGTFTPPEQTYSSNLSHEATSSLPYFDGIVRNREEPLDLTILNNAPASV